MQTILARTLTISVSIALLNAAIWYVASFSDQKIANENQTMENIQAGCLFLGSILFCVASYREDEKPFRILFLSLSLFYLTFFLREIELNENNITDAVLMVTNPPGRNYWLIAVWMIAIVIFLLNAKKTWSAFLDWVRTLQGFIIIAAGLFYGVADVFDKNLLDLPFETNIFLEELLDSSATSLMLLSAALTLVWRQSSKFT